MTLRKNTLYIAGEWVTSDSGGASLEVINAADRSVLGTIPAGTKTDVDRAVDAASAAFDEWARTPPWIRANYLLTMRDALAKMQDDIARTISLEVGTPLNISQRIQAGLPLQTLAGFAEAAKEMAWTNRNANSTIVRVPVGVVAAITPWNYPLHQLVAKVGAALAAGCTVVTKPSEIAPFSAFYLAEAAGIAKLPAGVFNIVTGDGPSVGEPLVMHPKVDAVSFTGSTSVGKRISELAAHKIGRVRLELGGKSASVVLHDADFERAVRSSVGSCFLNSGQTCSALTRLVVPRDKIAAVNEIAIRAAARFKIGHPLAPDTRLGPLASEAHLQRVRTLVENFERDGSGKRIYTGDLDADLETEGLYLAPVIFTDVDPDSPLAQTEIFGPVLSIMAHDGDDDAAAIANNSPYGLAGAVWSSDRARAMRVAQTIRAGQIDINGGAFNPNAPFGGFRMSGHGRELGPHGVEDFTELKAIQE